jgi:hypothetical protein
MTSSITNPAPVTYIYTDSVSATYTTPCWWNLGGPPPEASGIRLDSSRNAIDRLDQSVSVLNPSKRPGRADTHLPDLE